MTVALIMESRRTRLRPLKPSLIEELYVRSAIGEYPWMWRDEPATPQAFQDALWRDVLAQFAVEDSRTGQQIGLVSAYRPNLFHGFAYVSMVLLPGFERRVWPLESTLLFGNYLFNRFNLENLYSEAIESTYAQFKSGAGHLFTEVARYPRRLVVNGRREDLIITGMSREQWETVGLPLYERCTRPRSSNGEPASV